MESTDQGCYRHGHMSVACVQEHLPLEDFVSADRLEADRRLVLKYSVEGWVQPSLASLQRFAAFLIAFTVECVALDVLLHDISAVLQVIVDLLGEAGASGEQLLQWRLQLVNFVNLYFRVDHVVKSITHLTDLLLLLNSLESVLWHQLGQSKRFMSFTTVKLQTYSSCCRWMTVITLWSDLPLVIS